MSKLVGLWLLSLMLVAIVASAVTAQINRTPPRIVSGNDVGVRLEGTDRSTGKPVGVVVVRVDGEWVELGSVTKAFPAQTR